MGLANCLKEARRGRGIVMYLHFDTGYTGPYEILQKSSNYRPKMCASDEGHRENTQPCNTKKRGTMAGFFFWMALLFSMKCKLIKVIKNKHHQPPISLSYKDI